MTAFTPLRVRSHGSLLAGVASPETLCSVAAERGHTALGLTDRDNLHLAVRFLAAARGCGLAPVIGAELTARGTRSSVLLLPFDRRGWANLCALVTARHLDEGFALAHAVGEHHAGLHVIAESPALATALLAAGVPAALGAADERARGRTRGNGGTASAGGLWLGVRGLTAERAGLRARLSEAWRLGVPAVATGDVWLLDPADHETHRVAVAAARGELLERLPPSAFCARDACLHAPEVWVQRIRALCAGAGCAEQADPLLENNAALVARVRWTLATGTPIFPRAPLPEGVSGPAHLRELALEGLARRYPSSGAHRTRAATRRDALARLDTELAIVDRMGFTDYFLLVASIVGFARARGIPTVGRGSGASSIVSYALGVTSVDPLRHGLCFERFLHPQRRDCPDLDVDLCWRRRDEVIAHVYDTYGHDRVAMISTHATLGPRSAFREAAKALGVPLPRVNALARRVPRDLDASALEHALADARHPHAFGPEFREPRLAEALRLAARLAGAPRHLSVHCGGLVIGDRELTHHLPLTRAAKGVVVSQFEMRAVEAIGLVKMDLLGNRAITMIGECETLARTAQTPDAHETEPVGGEGCAAPAAPGDRAQRRMRGAGRTPSEWCAGSAPRASAEDAHPSPPAGDAPCNDEPHDDTRFVIPDDDAIAAAALSAGDTLNCFQLESPAMRHLLRMLSPQVLDDAIAAVALVRPGAAESGAKEAFCRRRRGLEPVAYPHARLHATLAETQGLLLYEEDVMRVASAFCGLPLAEGETLRRAIAKARDDEEFRFLESGFVAQAVRTGVTADEARTVWRELARFAAYAFCKAHAAGYGRLAWQSAALKARFPAEWAVAVLHHHAGMYPTWVHVEDLRRGGVGRAPVRFLAPCVERSAWDSTLVPTAEGARAVRVGLHRIAGLTHTTAQRVLACRPFAGLADLVDRARPTAPELDALILAGALDHLAHAPHRTRASLRLEARVLAALGAAAPARARAATRTATLPFDDPAHSLVVASAPRPGGEAVPELPELPPAELVRGEFEATGLWFHAHPLEVFATRESLADVTPAEQLESRVGQRVRVCGIPCAMRRVETRGGGVMAFVTLADRTGLVECVLFPDVHRRHGAALRDTLVWAEGRVGETLGAITLTVERAGPPVERPGRVA